MDAFTGDFIQRHAKAVSQYQKIIVVHVYELTATDTPSPFSVEVIHENLIEYIDYVPNRGVRKQLDYFKRYQKHIRTIFHDHGLPHGVHVHIPMKAGLLALWLKWTYRIPYILTEHYGIYNNYVNDAFSKRSWFFRQGTKLLFRHATAITTVSKSLAQDVIQEVGMHNIHIIPNVVDTQIFHFHPTQKTTTTFRFLHVSNMIPLKNVRSMLSAFAEVLKTNPDCEFVFVGAPVPEEEEYASTLGIRAHCVFKTSIPYLEVAEEMKRSDAMVVVSDYESQSCVVLESLCLGRPALVTQTGGVQELIDPSNGITVPVGNKEALVDALLTLIRTYSSFQLEEIARRAEKQFGYAVVGQQFVQLYTRFDKETTS